MLIIVKSKENEAHKNSILKSFGVTGGATPEQREAAEVIVARSSEVVCKEKNR